MSKTEKMFAVIANENKQVKATSANVDLSAGEVAASKELTESEKINAYLRAHAIEHYCAAVGADIQDITAVIDSCEKEAGVNWLYTAPKFDKEHTREEWEKQNTGAVFVENLGGQEWFKRPFVYGDARGIRSLVNACNRYADEQKNAQKRLQKKGDNGLEALNILAQQNGMDLRTYLESIGALK